MPLYDNRPHAVLLGERRQLYVNKLTGSDAYDGLSLTTAYATATKALLVAGLLDKRNYAVFINIADADYSAEPTLKIAVSEVPIIYSEAQIPLQIVGNSVTPANVILPAIVCWDTTVNFTGIQSASINTQKGYTYIENSRVTQLSASYYGTVETGPGMVAFGNAISAVAAVYGGTMTVYNAITVSGTPAYSTGFAEVNRGGDILFTAQPTGSATGPRYSVTRDGRIFTPGNIGGASYLPGNAVGTGNSGGRYDNTVYGDTTFNDALTWSGIGTGNGSGITALNASNISSGTLTLASGGVAFAASLTSSGSTNTLIVTDTGANGGNIKLVGDGATTPNKSMRAKGGNLEWINSGYSAVILTLQDGGRLVTFASATASAGLNLPHGAAPSSPVNGDVWTTTAGLFCRINGVTKTVTLT